MERRQLLRQIALLPAAVWLAGCSSAPDREAIAAAAATYDTDLDCSDTAGLWPAEIKTRDDNHYVERSPSDVEYCFNCLNYEAATVEGACGTCRTVKGPINPLGHCDSWTARG